MVDELIVKCLNRPNGCEFTCQRHFFAAYLKDDCLFVDAPWSVPRLECPQKALKKDILRNDVLRCPHCLVVCDGCGTEMQAAELGVSESTTDIALYFSSHDTPCPHILSHTGRSAQLSPFAMHHATANTSAQNLPPTLMYALPRLYPVNTGKASQFAPAARTAAPCLVVAAARDGKTKKPQEVIKNSTGKLRCTRRT